MLISSALLVQPDEGISDLVVDRIGDNLPQSTEKSRILVIPVGARHKCQQESENRNFDPVAGPPPCAAAPLSQAHERARWRDCRVMSARDVRPLVDARRATVAHEAGRRCAVLAPLSHGDARRWAQLHAMAIDLRLRGARLSRVAAHDGRFLRAVVAHDVACWLRALPPQFFVGGGAAAPAMS
ncbi:hypothetical protein F511_32679 [Dorcoceras hygrometricum]|uniref:Uncharacterized protein n=1 Tax=Dorcoceras hygrometricum TaxID=472368 RepID=A0A2Z7DCD2_9LAMI|nr:hypothetical protein F511_32679 [Dorcoceras hygrometricum]